MLARKVDVLVRAVRHTEVPLAAHARRVSSLLQRLGNRNLTLWKTYDAPSVSDTGYAQFNNLLAAKAKT
jgi:hypothetical protein